MPRFVLDLAIALSEFFAVTLVAPYSVGSALHEFVGPVRVVRFRYFWPRRYHRLSEGGVVAVNLEASWLARLQIPCFIIGQIFAIRRQVKQTGATVVNTHWMIPQGFSAVLACAFTRTVHVTHIHAGDVYFLKRIPFGSLIARFVMRGTAASFAAGSHVEAELLGLVGSETKARVRSMGVWARKFDVRGWAPNVKSPYVVFVGRLVEKKGATYLLSAMEQVRQHRPDLSLVIVGSGPLEADLKKEAAELMINEFVHFAGPLPHEQVIGYLQGSAVACVPSVIDRHGETEGMPTVVIEAMAAGTRVVGTNVDGIPDVLKDKSNGWLAQPADAADLARCLLDALESPVGDAVALEGKATAERYDWSRVASEYAAVLEGVIMDRRV